MELNQVSQAVENWILINRKFLEIQKEEKRAKKEASESMQQAGITEIKVLENSVTVDLKKSPSDIKLLKGLTFDEVEQHLPGVIDFTPTIKASTARVKSVCLSGEAANYFSFTVNSIISKRKNTAEPEEEGF